MDDYSSPDFETTALLGATENGNIGPNRGEGKHSADGESEVTNKLGRLSWDAGVENDFQLFLNVMILSQALCKRVSILLLKMQKDFLAYRTT